MRKKTIVLGLLIVAVAALLLAGCGSSQKPATPPAAPAATNHAQMPSGDPMPMMKDMDKNLQDIMKNMQNGKLVEAQQAASQLAATTDKVVLHMSDAAMKDNMRKAAQDIKMALDANRVDMPSVEDKVKAMQGMMPGAMKHLESQSHKGH